MKKSTFSIPDIETIDKWRLLDMLHVAKRQKNREAAEYIDKEFLRRDKIIVNQSLRGKL